MSLASVFDVDTLAVEENVSGSLLYSLCSVTRFLSILGVGRKIHEMVSEVP